MAVCLSGDSQCVIFDKLFIAQTDGIFVLFVLLSLVLVLLFVLLFGLLRFVLLYVLLFGLLLLLRSVVFFVFGKLHICVHAEHPLFVDRHVFLFGVCKIAKESSDSTASPDSMEDVGFGFTSGQKKLQSSDSKIDSSSFLVCSHC